MTLISIREVTALDSDPGYLEFKTLTCLHYCFYEVVYFGFSSECRIFCHVSHTHRGSSGTLHSFAALLLKGLSGEVSGRKVASILDPSFFLKSLRKSDSDLSYLPPPPLLLLWSKPPFSRLDCGNRLLPLHLQVNSRRDPVSKPHLVTPLPRTPQRLPHSPESTSQPMSSQ